MAGQGKGVWPAGQWGGEGWGSEGAHGPLVCGGRVLPACEGDLSASVLTGCRRRGAMSVGTYSAVTARAGVGDSPLQLRAMTDLPKPQTPRLESRDNNRFLTVFSEELMHLCFGHGDWHTVCPGLRGVRPLVLLLLRAPLLKRRLSSLLTDNSRPR